MLTLTINSTYILFPPNQRFIHHEISRIFKQAVAPTTASTTDLIPKVKEIVETISLQVSPILALDKKYENFKVKYLVKPLFSNMNYVDTDNQLNIRKYFKFILVDTGSIEVEHNLNDNSDPYSIAYYKVTTKKILSPFE